MRREDRKGWAFLAAVALYLGAHMAWFCSRTDLPTGSRTAKVLAQESLRGRR